MLWYWPCSDGIQENEIDSVAELNGNWSEVKPFMKKLALKKAWNYFLRHKFSQDDLRNLRLGGIVSIYGISFALEKGLNTFGMPQSDLCWFLVYGVLALLSTYWWFEDAILDLWEKHTTEDDELYAGKTEQPSFKENGRV